MNTIWKFLNGKKSAIGSIVGAVALWASQKGWLDQTDLFLIASIVSAWTGVAIGHKFKKAIKK